MWRKVEQNDDCLLSFLDPFQCSTLWSCGFFFSAFAVTHPLLRLACRNHTCLCSTTAKAKLKLSKMSLSRASENQMYSFTTQTGLWVWNALVHFFFLSQMLNSHPEFGLKKKQQCSTCSFSGWQLQIIPNVGHSNSKQKWKVTSSPLTECRWLFQ